MDISKNVGGRDRLARAALAIGLAFAAIRSFRNGKRLRGLLTAAVAVGLGFNASTKYCGVNDALGIDTTADDGDITDPVHSTTGETAEVDLDFSTSEDTDAATTGGSAETATTATSRVLATLTCAACDEPIVNGQRRGPNEDGEIVHDDCR